MNVTRRLSKSKVSCCGGKAEFFRGGRKTAKVELGGVEERRGGFASRRTVARNTVAWSLWNKGTAKVSGEALWLLLLLLLSKTKEKE